MCIYVCSILFLALLITIYFKFFLIIFIFFKSMFLYMLFNLEMYIINLLKSWTWMSMYFKSLFYSNTVYIIIFKVFKTCKILFLPYYEADPKKMFIMLPYDVSYLDVLPILYYTFFFIILHQFARDFQTRINESSSIATRRLVLQHLTLMLCSFFIVGCFAAVKYSVFPWYVTI